MTRNAPLATASNSFDRVFSPVFPAAPGLDALRDMFDAASDVAHNQSSFPPYDVIKYNDGRTYDIVLAVAGFSEDDIDLFVENNRLVVASKTQENTDNHEQSTGTQLNDELAYLHKGIAKRSFMQKFLLQENMEVRSANMENGLLRIRLQRNEPESPPRKKIPIDT